jgi:uncharacterized membrane protein YkvA (DUF1232 family)
MGIASKVNPFVRFRVIWKVLRAKGTPTWSKALFLVTAGVYLISPIDLLPELLVGPLGLADDLVVIPFLAWLTTKAAPRWVRREAEAEVTGHPTPAAEA